MGFDKTAFATLLIQAKGDRSINEYALHSGVTAAHISRLSRALLDAPPSPQTIQKLADKAYNNVTYDDMMIAAGHITKKNATESIAKRPLIDNNDEKILDDPQIRAIARASRKLSSDKKELLQKLAESMIEEAIKDGEKDK